MTSRFSLGVKCVGWRGTGQRNLTLETKLPREDVRNSSIFPVRPTISTLGNHTQSTEIDTTHVVSSYKLSFMAETTER